MGHSNVTELAELMGAATSVEEAEAMAEILDERKLAPDALSDDEFFALIPAAIERAGKRAVSG